ncbi:hypothetical protein H1R20_g15371, partial [Candolleomyces eurysporus]
MFRLISQSRSLATVRSSHHSRIAPASSRLLSSKPKDSSSHTADSYAKDDVDPTPPQDSTIFRVDNSGSETSQKPYEPATGQWSRAGARTSEYEHTRGNYTTEGGPGLRYGAKEEYNKEKGPETPKRDEGPENKSRGGRA